MGHVEGGLHSSQQGLKSILYCFRSLIGPRNKKAAGNGTVEIGINEYGPIRACVRFVWYYKKDLS